MRLAQDYNFMLAFGYRIFVSSSRTQLQKISNAKEKVKYRARWDIEAILVSSRYPSQSKIVVNYHREFESNIKSNFI